jgi:hypothetical protein
MIISHVMYDVMSCGHPTTRLYRRVGTCTYKIVHNATFYIEGLSSLMTTQLGYCRLHLYYSRVSVYSRKEWISTTMKKKVHNAWFRPSSTSILFATVSDRKHPCNNIGSRQ